jgi:hypothetical protein
VRMSSEPLKLQEKLDDLIATIRRRLQAKS